MPPEGKNEASGQVAAILGGQNNTASGLSAVLCGGSKNTASGQNAAVVGGFDNTALGRNATADHDGAVVFGDTTSARAQKRAIGSVEPTGSHWRPSRA